MRPEALLIGPSSMACKANSKCRYITRNQKETAPLTQWMRETIRVKTDDLSMLPLLSPTNTLLLSLGEFVRKRCENRLTISTTRKSKKDQLRKPLHSGVPHRHGIRSSERISRSNL